MITVHEANRDSYKDLTTTHSYDMSIQKSRILKYGRRMMYPWPSCDVKRVCTNIENGWCSFDSKMIYVSHHSFHFLSMARFNLSPVEEVLLAARFIYLCYVLCLQLHAAVMIHSCLECKWCLPM